MGLDINPIVELGVGLDIWLPKEACLVLVVGRHECQVLNEIALAVQPSWDIEDLIPVYTGTKRENIERCIVLRTDVGLLQAFSG